MFSLSRCSHAPSFANRSLRPWLQESKAESSAQKRLRERCKPEMMGVPVAILEQAKLHLKNVKATVEAARAVIANKGAGSRSLPDVKTLAVEISFATKARTLITQSLALVAKMTH